jgi:hypothetical protein
MYDLPNKKKSNLSELPQRRKKRFKKNIYKKTDVALDDWAYLEWTCVDSLSAKVNE